MSEVTRALQLLPPAPSREWLDTVSYRHVPRPGGAAAGASAAVTPPGAQSSLPAVLVAQLRLAVERCGVTAATVVVDLQTGAVTAH